MGYFEYLKQLLRPMRLYDLDRGFGRDELFAIGEELDRQNESMEALLREAVPARADSYGLDRYEEIMPFVPAYWLESERRAAISALLRIDGGSFTLDALNATVAGCGMDAMISEGSLPGTVEVAMLNIRGIPEDFSSISRRIEQILPCHLEPVYKFIFSSWNEIMSFISSWNELHLKAHDWKTLEIYTEN